MTTIGRLQVDLVGNTRHFRTSMRAASRLVTTFHHDLQQVGFAAAALTAPLLALGKAAATTFGEIQRTAVTAGAKFGSTSKQLKILEKDILRISKASEYTGSQIADMMNLLAQRGVNQKDATKAAPHIVNFAIAAETDGATAAEMMTSALRQTGRGFEEAGAMSDLLATSVSRTALNADNLATALKYLGPVAHTSGMGLENMLKVSAAMTEVFGSGASQAFRGLRAMLGQMAKNKDATGDAAEALRELGLAQLFVGRKTMPPMEAVAQALTKTIVKMGGDLNQFQSVLARAMPRNAAVVTAAFTELESALEAVGVPFREMTGYAGGLAQKRINTFQGRILILNSNLEALYYTIGDKLEPSLNKLIQGAQGAIDHFSRLDTATVNSIANFAALGTAILGGVTFMGLFAQILSPFVGLLANVGRMFISSLSVPALAAGAAIIGLITLAGAMENTWPGVLAEIKDGFKDLVKSAKYFLGTLAKFNMANLLGEAFSFVEYDAALRDLKEAGFKLQGGMLTSIKDGGRSFWSADEIAAATTQIRQGSPDEQGRFWRTDARRPEDVLSTTQAQKILSALEVIGAYDSDAPAWVRDIGKELAESRTTESIAKQSLADLKDAFKTGMDLTAGQLSEWAMSLGEGAVDAILGEGTYADIKAGIADLTKELTKLREAMKNAKIGATTEKNKDKLSPEKPPGAAAPRLDPLSFDAFKNDMGKLFGGIGDIDLGGIGQLVDLVKTFIQAADVGLGILAVLAKLLVGSEQFQEIMDAVGAILQNVSNALGMVLEPLKPVIGAISIALGSALGSLAPLFETLGMILEPFAPIIITLGEILGSLLMPFAFMGQALSLLSPVLDLVGMMFNWLANAIKVLVNTVFTPLLFVWNAFLDIVLWILDNIVDRIPGVNTGKSSDIYKDVAGKKVDTSAWWEQVKNDAGNLLDIDAQWDDFYDKMSRATDEFDSLANSAGNISEQLKNVPDGYKVARARLAAMSALGTTAISRQVPKFGDGGIVSSPTLALIGEKGEREAVIPESDWGTMGGVHIGHITVMANDPDEMYRKINKKARRSSLMRGQLGAGINGPRYRG